MFVMIKIGFRIIDTLKNDTCTQHRFTNSQEHWYTGILTWLKNLHYSESKYSVELLYITLIKLLN